MDRLKSLSNLFIVQKQQIHQVIKPHLKKVYDKCLHSYETRKPQQIKATVDKVYQLSQNNLNRLNSIPTESLKLDKEKYKNCIFICIHGVPAYKNEFLSLDLPGKIYEVVSNGFEFDKGQNYRQQNLLRCRFSFNAQKIHQIVEQNPKKDVIFVYHSFGTYNLSVYFQKYGIERVKGLIEIGAAPVRQYIYITEVTNYVLGFSEEDLVRNNDDVAGKGLQKLMDRINKELSVRWDYFPSVTYGASFLSYFKSPQFPIIFDLNRRYPNILKLMIFGEEDNIFQQQLITQRAVFYAEQKLENQKQLRQKYSFKYKTQPQNIQQKFIFMIPKGKHSLHLQKKNQPIIRKAVDQYLDMIIA